jgi:hypothetical protein
VSHGISKPFVKIFAFHGTVSGYGESNTRGVNRIPIVRGICNENTNETTDRGVGAGHCCGGGVLVDDSGTCWCDTGRRGGVIVAICDIVIVCWSYLVT